MKHIFGKSHSEQYGAEYDQTGKTECTPSFTGQLPRKNHYGKQNRNRSNHEQETFMFFALGTKYSACNNPLGSDENSMDFFFSQIIKTLDSYA